MENQIEVAVVSYSERDYRLWLKENQKPNEKYTRVYHIACVRGRVFNRVEKIYNWYDLTDIDNILFNLKIRVRP